MPAAQSLLNLPLPVEEGEFWTARQRAALALHEVPYRACFKPQLPAYFIERHSKPGDAVLDPFVGRGTTIIESALRGRIPIGNDINPLSIALARPRLRPPTADAIAQRCREIAWRSDERHDPDLLAFYHPETLAQILALRRHLLDRPALDPVDDWIRMVAITRLTGHSQHFLSVYTLPPNQATSAERQRKINAKLGQAPEPRDVAEIIQRKSRLMRRGLDEGALGNLARVAARARFRTGPADNLAGIPSASVDLVITSPPFLSEVDYRFDNWLRCWFLGIDVETVAVTQSSKVESWQAMMRGSLAEMRRVTRPGGRIVVEVGEAKKGRVKLEEPLLEAGTLAGLEPERILINRQSFTKTSNCWGIKNNEDGTNTNRIVVFVRKK
jgi:hypothetical protein